MRYAIINKNNCVKNNDLINIVISRFSFNYKINLNEFSIIIIRIII